MIYKYRKKFPIPSLFPDVLRFFPLPAVIIYIHGTLLPNPSPYSPFDEMGYF